MKNLITLIFLMPISLFSQSIDFGVEVSNNYNFVEKIDDSDPYALSNLALSVVDLGGDTSDIFFSKFKMANNFELPLYFRVNLRKRWFFDAKLSNSSNTLSMEGVSNYNDQYYTTNYGTYDQFIADAFANGFMNADSTDYENYINSARDLNESEIRTVEQFKLLSFTGNAGIRLFPHKSVKMVIAAGFTIKHKYRKHLYNYVDFSNNYIHDIRAVESGLDWYAEKSTYFNLMMGLELYRFRLSAFVQSGFSFTFPQTFPTSEVSYSALGTPFDVVRSYGFSISANLFSVDIGKGIKKDDVSSDDVIISNVKRKKNRWDIGIRYDRRGYNDMFTFYSEPDLSLSLLDVDTVLYNNNGSFVEALDMEMVTLGDIKRISWGGRLSGVLNIYLSQRLGIRGSLSGSRLTYDVGTTQLKATVLNDSTGMQYLVTPSTPNLRRAVYRKTVNVIDIGTDVTYKVVDRDLFSIQLFAGLGVSGLSYVFGRDRKSVV